MRKCLQANTCLLLTFAAMWIQSQLSAQTVQITASPGQSGNIVIGPNFYHVSENIYTDTEIGATNFTSAATAINHIDFNVFAVGTVTTVTNFNLYLKEVPAATQTFTAGVYNTTGYTLVYSGTYTPAVTGWMGVDFTTSFVRTAGNNLQLLVERLDNVQHGGYSFRASLGNNTSNAIASSRRENLATLPAPGTTSLNTTTTFRPQIQLRHVNPNDAAIAQVYTLGKIPVPFATPHVISANIVNNGAATQTNLNVTLDITGANTFSDIQTIPSLAPGAAVNVQFAAFTPTNSGINTVSVSIPADDFAGDNNVIISQEVTLNAYNYAYSTIASGAVGFNANVNNPTGTGDIVAKFTTSSPTSVNQVGVNFGGGGQPFRIGIWDKSGTGVPGNLLWESTDQVSTAGLFNLPINPTVSITDTFYIGVRQIGSTNIQFAYQNEIPIRPNTFFFTNPTGNTVWADFAPANPFRFMIEPRLTIANDVGITTISNPAPNSTADNCGITPQATVVNFGSNSQTIPFDVTFSIKQAGNIVYTDTRQVVLNSGASSTIDFTAFTGSVSGADSSFVYTSLATDGARNNDTVVNKFTTDNFSYGLATLQTGGYEFANSTDCALPSGMQQTYNWITETSNEVNWGANGDDSVLNTPIALPFNFYFMGNVYNQFWIGSNGWISFNDPTLLTGAQQRTPVAIPTTGGIENYIAGALTDLDLTTATYADAHTYYGGNAAQFIITFQHAHIFGSATDFISFQLILNAADSSVVIQYNEAETSSPIPSGITNFCSVGIENVAGVTGISYRLNGSRGPMFGSPLAVKFRPVAVVPVTLLNFTVQRNARVNDISWSTGQEINSRNFTVEHSSDGRNFTAIGVVAANGNSNRVLNYAFTHNSPAKGINYYRLRLVDMDNIAKFGPTRSVKNEGVAAIAVYPNPVREKMSVSINADKADRGVISITDMSGKLVYSNVINIAAGNNTILINSSSIGKGTYLLNVKLSDDMVVKKFNKL